MKTVFITLVITICWLSCANPGSLTGGVKDTTPPKALSFSPPNQSTNFSGKKLQIQFDEYIQLNDVFNQVVVSPPTNKSPALSLQGKKLTIEFDEELLPDRTYTINFGTAIRDLNENNILKNFQFVFATGAILDSLIATGNVIDAINSKAVADILVMLHPAESSDSTFYINKPYYFARTDESGNFKIGNIKEGGYKVFVLDDQNFNYLYDLPNEKIGFLDSLLQVDTIAKSVSIEAFTPENKSLKLLSVKARRYGKVDLVFSNNTPDERLDVADVKREWSAKRDSLTLWYSDIYQDSLLLTFTTDTGIDKRSISLNPIDRDSAFLKNRLKIGSNLKIPSTRGDQTTQELPRYPLGKSLQINFASPLAELAIKSIRLYEDTISKEAAIKSISPESDLSRIYLIDYPWKSETKYILTIPKGAAEDIFGLKNDSTAFEFETRTSAEYGNLNFTLELDSIRPIVFEILNGQGTAVFTRAINNSKTQKFKLSYFKVGNYTARIVIDENNNGKWDPGNFELRKQSERFLLYKEPINLRSEWELDFTWKPIFP